MNGAAPSTKLVELHSELLLLHTIYLLPQEYKLGHDTNLI